MVTNIFSRINLNKNWQKISIKENDAYLIAIKEDPYKKDTIDVEKVLQIRLEMGIDSGIKNKPLTVQYINLSFTDMTSGDNELNKITAFTRLLNIPKEFYLRVVSVYDGIKDIKSGETSISININSMDLGA